MTTRSGLKKAHGKFEAINKRLERDYKSALKDGDFEGLEAIAYVWQTMCNDSLLRHKLMDSGMSSLRGSTSYLASS